MEGQVDLAASIANWQRTFFGSICCRPYDEITTLLGDQHKLVSMIFQEPKQSWRLA